MSSANKTPVTLAGVAGATGKQKMPESKIPQNNRAGNQQTEPEMPPEAPQPLPWPSSFRIGTDGVYICEDAGNGTYSYNYVFSPLHILARTCDGQGKNWGLLVKVQAPNGQWHELVIPVSMLAGSTTVFRELLMSLGLRIASANYKYLLAYLSGANPQQIVRSVDRVGWHGGCFLLPEKCYPAQSEEQQGGKFALLCSEGVNPFQCKGALHQWQEHIGRYLAGNSRLILGVCAAFAAPLLKPCGVEGAGIGFEGDSSAGKTTALQVAGSVCGGGGQNGYIHRWRLTDNALESLAVMHNDNLLILDELGQSDAKTAAESVYMLANGQGKARAQKDGSARVITEWRVLFLSSGEMGLEQKLKEGGHRHMAGQGVRMVGIRADAGKGHKLFDELHGYPDGKTLADALKLAVSQYYGTPLRGFLEHFTANIAENTKAARAVLEAFEQRVCPPEADGQVKRVCRLFALLTAGGELAIRFGVLPLAPQSAWEANARCFQDWITLRGGLEAAEARDAACRLRAFISANRMSRFEPWAGEPRLIANCAGLWREKDGALEFMLYRDTFRNEICLGGNPHTIAGHLARLGLLVPDKSGNFLQPHSPPMLRKTVRFYTIKGDILDFDG
ncbi:DUF927 domain-containing protein [Desulfovibrio falkowii]|uniref:DUF927 domain-containing protein n=1 Tax=Desulfovibrio falkowii TaxID=3136602 RepID=A0ABQ0E7B3_9BACT